jgi:hypothetical protein
VGRKKVQQRRPELAERIQQQLPPHPPTNSPIQTQTRHPPTKLPSLHHTLPHTITSHRLAPPPPPRKSHLKMRTIIKMDTITLLRTTQLPQPHDQRIITTGRFLLHTTKSHLRRLGTRIKQQKSTLRNTQLPQKVFRLR